MEVEKEEVTKHGEFISSYFAWLPLQKQKENAKKMANITKNKKENGKIKNSSKISKEDKNDI